MPRFLLEPWPWYVAGPLLGLMAPVLLWLDNRQFGISSNLRHLCAAWFPRDIAHFRYDWRTAGRWNLAFAAGILLGGFIAGWLLRNPDPVAIAASTREALGSLGIRDFTGLVPDQLFGIAALSSPRTIAVLVAGGLLVGFGTAYAGGCTSGHGILGMADLQPASLLALIGFFAGGLLGTWFLLPVVLRWVLA